MTTRMLIDARHREETRVAVVKGNRIEEFDFESAEHKQLKGNIYLAKVTRVEPSLQAAFIDYGGNRHGFLAFSEIHPDYYQIPKEDRERLLREEAEHAAEEAALRGEYDDDVLEGDVDDDGGHDDGRGDDRDDDDHGDGRDDGEPEGDGADDRADYEGNGADEETGEEDSADEDRGGDARGEEARGEAGGRDQRGGRGRGRGRKAGDAEADELRRKRMALRRRYKIQDVIHRRQVLLVQIVKEERGNKGAALTTYLSLAGRYCVLMPNTSHGGGISRKISNAADRKRLKTIIAEMNLPSTMGCIVRTAGLQRTKPEIRRDFDYLARLWDEIREKTLKAVAPALIHNDSDLIKRAIRDIYNREIEEVIVEGEDGYRAAKDFMKLLMPSHARRVKAYADAVSLYQRFGVEDQLAAMYHPVVQLKSGGYLVINPTEALVSIDINSGRSTREHGIEQTAVATNLEAAREIARQLRLRDMAGLVVIDFIDMEVNSNVRKVEKAMKEALKDDRARIQVGRISSFGLMEMSRQRLRTGVLEASTRGCPHCEGTGLVRTASSAGLSALRLLEEEAARGKGSIITLRASQEAAFYVLNNKRRELDEIENRYGVRIGILPDGETEGARMSVDASGPRPERVVTYEPIVDLDEDDDIPEEEYELEEEEEAAEEPRRAEGRGDRDRPQARADDAEGEGVEEARDSSTRRRRRRRRGRRGRPDDAAPGEGGETGEGAERADRDGEAAEVYADGEEAGEAHVPAVENDEEEGASRRSRRGRRGGRRRRGGRDREDAREGQETAGTQDGDAEPEPEMAEADAEPVKPARKSRSRKKVEAEVEAEAPAEAAPEPVAGETPKPRRSRAKAKTEPVVETASAVEPAPAEVETPAKPKRPGRGKAGAGPSAKAVADNPARLAPALTADPEPVSDSAAANDADIDEETGEPRRGWWQRTFGN